VRTSRKQRKADKKLDKDREAMVCAIQTLRTLPIFDKLLMLEPVQHPLFFPLSPPAPPFLSPLTLLSKPLSIFLPVLITIYFFSSIPTLAHLPFLIGI